jgi:hypothetical protein
MKFVSPEEAGAWAKRFVRPDSHSTFPDCEPKGSYALRVLVENAPAHQHYWIAKQLVRALSPEWDTCMFWVSLVGVWRSNENLHLYYRLRQSYGEESHLVDRPALFALKHEVADVESFVHLAVLFGWDGYLVTSEDYARVHVHHDGFAVVSSETESLVSEVAAGFKAAHLKVEIYRPAV